MVETFLNNKGRWLWVPAFAGMTELQKSMIRLLSQIIARAQA
jgi:hypothetical protein